MPCRFWADTQCFFQKHFPVREHLKSIDSLGKVWKTIVFLHRKVALQEILLTPRVVRVWARDVTVLKNSQMLVNIHMCML